MFSSGLAPSTDISAMLLVSIAFSMQLGSLYTCTMVSTLNMREDMRTSATKCLPERDIHVFTRMSFLSLLFSRFIQNSLYPETSTQKCSSRSLTRVLSPMMFDRPTNLPKKNSRDDEGLESDSHSDLWTQCTGTDGSASGETFVDLEDPQEVVIVDGMAFEPVSPTSPTYGGRPSRLRRPQPTALPSRSAGMGIPLTYMRSSHA